MSSGDAPKAHDMTDVKDLSAQQQAELQKLEAQQQVAGTAPVAGVYRIVDNQPSAKLLSGYSIPLVGLGTWCVAPALLRMLRHTGRRGVLEEPFSFRPVRWGVLGDH